MTDVELELRAALGDAMVEGCLRSGMRALRCSCGTPFLTRDATQFIPQGSGALIVTPLCPPCRRALASKEPS